MMKEEWIGRIYAGWLGKIIGIRLGAPVEGWTYDEIKNMFGEITGYVSDYKNFAADDDSNGPVFLLRALDDAGDKTSIKPQDVADALLNYAPYEHGFFWWGGYGVSTEHTAYLNLRNGIKAPASGSIRQNGRTVAEQIGGQIFIDTWGMAAAGDPELAAGYARAAASVTHDGNGVYGGIFIAVCVSLAFIEDDIGQVINRALEYIPADCEYTRVVRAVQSYHAAHPDDWRACFRYVRENFGYDRYPGNCHIIPNAAVVILALLYGNAEFSRTICISTMCGWDTDCNDGNVASIIGIHCGLDGIDNAKWREPINDLLIGSGVMGSMNIMDIPATACHIARLAYEAAGEEIPEKWRDILVNKEGICHFEFPGSTHTVRVRTDEKQGNNQRTEFTVKNSSENSHTGQRSLKITARPLEAGSCMYIYKKTYYDQNDFNDSRYDPSFSPVIYPGQTIHVSVLIPDYSGTDIKAAPYVHDKHSGTVYRADMTAVKNGEWAELNWTIPAVSGALIDEAGVMLDIMGRDSDYTEKNIAAVCFVDDLYFDGSPDYTMELSAEEEEHWNTTHIEVSQFSRLKGLLYLEDGMLQLSCADFGECYTGGYIWEDYTAEFDIIPVSGEWHMVNIRVRGAEHSYSAGLLPDGKFALLKNDGGYKVIVQTDLNWKNGEEYIIRCSADGNRISASVNGHELSCTDNETVIKNGAVGLSVRNGSHISCKSIRIGRNGQD